MVMNDSVEGLESSSHSETSEQDKLEERGDRYALLEVVNADGGGGVTASYLRLGVVPDLAIAGNPDAPRATGEDLAALVTGFVDDEEDPTVVPVHCDVCHFEEGAMHRDPPADEDAPPPELTRLRHARDDASHVCRYWGGEKGWVEVYVPPKVRKGESARLHTKGGWRDHSDGNRITTTRGDKVEVVRGNFRMLVLGRRDEPDYTAGWDVSGGHVSESSQTFQGESRIEWVKNYDGTWRVVETTVKGDVYSTFHGDTHDWFFGNEKVSTTGCEEPRLGKENPRIVDRTWADEIKSYTGSPKRHVPVIEDTTWADSIRSTTHADFVRSTTCVGGEQERVQAEQRLRAEAWGTDPPVDKPLSPGTISDTTYAKKIKSTTYGDVEDTIHGDSTTTIYGSETETMYGMVNEFTLGGETSVTLCVEPVTSVQATLLSTDISAALAKIELELALIKLEIDMGISIEVNADKKFKVKKIGSIDIDPQDVDIAITRTGIAVLNVIL